MPPSPASVPPPGAGPSESGRAEGRADDTDRAEAAPAEADRSAPGLLSREAVGFWFLGLGALGLVRAWMRATRHGAFDADTVSLLWLFGSAALALVGAVRIWRSARRPRR